MLFRLDLPLFWGSSDWSQLWLLAGFKLWEAAAGQRGGAPTSGKGEPLARTLTQEWSNMSALRANGVDCFTVCFKKNKSFRVGHVGMALNHSLKEIHLLVLFLFLTISGGKCLEMVERVECWFSASTLWALNTDTNMPKHVGAACKEEKEEGELRWCFCWSRKPSIPPQICPF